MYRRAFVILLALLAAPLAADTVIFTETCATSPAAELPSSTTVTVGSGWGSKQSIGSPTGVINSGTADCSASANENDQGYVYIASPNPSTDVYYADYIWIDGGNVGTDDSIFVVVNFIDANNFYACVARDDATSGSCAIAKVSGGTATTINGGNCAGRATNEELRCHIDYSGANPTLTFSNVTDATTLASGTDSSSPLTETKTAGIGVGNRVSTGAGDITVNLDFDTFEVVEVSAAAAARHTIVIQ